MADLKNAFARTKGIDSFIFVGHSGVPGSYNGYPDAYAPDAYLFLHSEPINNSSDVSASDISQLSTKNVMPGAFMFLCGCGTAATRNQPRVGVFDRGPGLGPGKSSLAAAFARRFKTPFWGFTPHVTPGPKAWFPGEGYNFNNFLGNVWFHNGGDEIAPTRIDP